MNAEHVEAALGVAAPDRRGIDVEATAVMVYRFLTFLIVHANMVQRMVLRLVRGYVGDYLRKRGVDVPEG